MQGTLERAVGAVTQEETHIVGSGRTDAGAHAVGQVVAFSTSSDLSTAVLQRALNAVLPRDVAVTSARDVARDFHPRFDARQRLYRYLIWNRPVRSPFWLNRAAHVAFPLDVEAMNAAAVLLVGEHDFGAFTPSACEGSRVRILYHAECRRDGDLVTVDVTGTGFMRQMVRSMVGTLVEVGSGRLSLQSFGDILDSADRRRAGRTMGSGGLYLIDVSYGESNEGTEEHFVPSMGGEHL